MVAIVVDVFYTAETAVRKFVACFLLNKNKREVVGYGISKLPSFLAERSSPFTPTDHMTPQSV